LNFSKGRWVDHAKSSDLTGDLSGNLTGEMNRNIISHVDVPDWGCSAVEVPCEVPSDVLSIM